MAPTSPEWLLWAHKLDSRHNLLSKQINVNTTDIKQELMELRIDAKNLAASTAHLQAENATLRTQLVKLETEMADRDRVHAETLSVLRTSIASHYKSVQDGAHLLHEWKAEVVVGFQNKDLEIRDLKTIVEKLGASKSDKIANAIANVEGPLESAIEEWSAVHRPQSINPANIGINLAPQGSGTLEEYLQYGKRAVPDMYREAIKALEIETVKVFARNIKEKQYRIRLWSRMQEIGWSWQNIQIEIRAMVEDTKICRKSRRILQQPPVTSR